MKTDRLIRTCCAVVSTVMLMLIAYELSGVYHAFN